MAESGILNWRVSFSSNIPLAHNTEVGTCGLTVTPEEVLSPGWTGKIDWISLSFLTSRWVGIKSPEQKQLQREPTVARSVRERPETFLRDPRHGGFTGQETLLFTWLLCHSAQTQAQWWNSQLDNKTPGSQKVGERGYTWKRIHTREPQLQKWVVWVFCFVEGGCFVVLEFLITWRFENVPQFSLNCLWTSMRFPFNLLKHFNFSTRLNGTCRTPAHVGWMVALESIVTVTRHFLPKPTPRTG